MWEVIYSNGMNFVSSLEFSAVFTITNGELKNTGSS